MNRIKDLRNSQIPKMSQEKLGQLVGVGRSAVAMWESGKSEPDNSTLIRLADIFEVTTDCLLGRTEPKENPTPANRDGLSEKAQNFMTLVDGLTPDQQQLLLSQLQAWTEQNKRQALAAQRSGEEKGPKSAP